MTENDFLTISYLQSGSSLQQKAYHTLSTSPLFTILKDFNPVLTGTMPLDLFVDGSDLDICCEVYDQKEFKNIL
ncbi:MAG: DUF4269 domain-containing protein, partial [Cyclobacteriaceae bacterium]|nr:DUF4269 domain-containing protein [Cyclobacteriaceae bacterium]